MLEKVRCHGMESLLPAHPVAIWFSRIQINMESVLRAIYGYLFLVFMVRVVGRRPGKQMTPFEFVLIFFIGGLMLTAMVGDEASFTNALIQIMTIALLHALLAWLRTKSSRFAVITDGTPLILFERGKPRLDIMQGTRMSHDDIMASARDSGLQTLDDVEYAVLERNGQITIIPHQHQ